MDESFRLTPQPRPQKSLNYGERVKAGLQRGGLRQVSKDKQRYNDLYSAAIDDDDEIQACVYHKMLSDLGVSHHIVGDKFVGTKESLTRHHEKGRDKMLILQYKYCCIYCHDWIHKNPNKARELKILLF